MTKTFVASGIVDADGQVCAGVTVAVDCLEWCACWLLAFLGSVPLIGNASPYRGLVESVLACCWLGSMLMLAWRLWNDLEASQAFNAELNIRHINAEQELKSVQAELDASRAEVVRLERLATIGELVCGAAHDLNNALTPLVAGASVLDSSIPEPSRSLWSAVQASTEQAREITSQLLQFRGGGIDQVEKEVIDISECVQQAIQLTSFRWHDEAEKWGVDFDLRLGQQDECRISGHRTEIVQLITNLLLNAFDAMPDGGQVVASVARTEDGMQIAISDEGIGMTAEQRKACFDPFFTTKDEGSGLGLSVCQRIASRHGAAIEVFANIPKGSRFVVKFPRLNQEHHTQRESRRLLLIEDDERVRHALAITFESIGWISDAAEVGSLGLRMMADRNYDLVIADFAMPGMNGRDIVAALKEIRGDVPVAILSGWSVADIQSEFKDEDPLPDLIIQKPVTKSELIVHLKKLGFTEE